MTTREMFQARRRGNIFGMWIMGELGKLTVEDRAMRAACAIERILCAFACERAKDRKPCDRCSAGYFQAGERDEVAAAVARELRADGVSPNGKED